MVALALSNSFVGAWLLFFPGSFYRDFPGFGDHWVAALPPYNERLLTDYGGALLAIAVLLWLAARFLEQRLVQAALIVLLVQATPRAETSTPGNGGAVVKVFLAGATGAIGRPVVRRLTDAGHSVDVRCSCAHRGTRPCAGRCPARV